MLKFKLIFSLFSVPFNLNSFIIGEGASSPLIVLIFSYFQKLYVTVDVHLALHLMYCVLLHISEIDRLVFVVVRLIDIFFKCVAILF